MLVLRGVMLLTYPESSDATGDEFHTNHHDYPELNSGELNYRLTIPPLYPHPHREINPESSPWERAQERIN